jgi:hypothetical protein
VTKLEEEVAALRKQLNDLAERVRISAVAEAFLRGEHPVRLKDYALIDDVPTQVTSISSEGKWTYFNGRNSVEPFRVPPSDNIQRLYTIAEVAKIVARAIDAHDLRYEPNDL